MDSDCIPFRFLLESYWIPVGFQKDSTIGEFLQDELVAPRMRPVGSRRTNEWRETSQDAIILLDLAGRFIMGVSQDDLVGLRMGRARSRRTKESRETSQDEFIP